MNCKLLGGEKRMARDALKSYLTEDKGVENKRVTNQFSIRSLKAKRFRSFCLKIPYHNKLI